MAPTDLDNLESYRRAERSADETGRIVTTGGGFARSPMGNPIIRAADSIGASIAAGSGRGSHPDSKQFVRTTRSVWNERRHGLRSACRRGLLSQAEGNRHKPLIPAPGPRLNAYPNSIGRFPGGAADNLAPGTWLLAP